MPDERDERDDSQRGFKVEDRRRFTADGRARSDDEQAEDQPTERPAGESAASEAEGLDAGAGSAEAAGAAAAGARQGGGEPQELSFTSFVIGIASQALVLLGLMPDPQSGAVRKDLPQAKAMIDILSMLHDKTAGNLDEHESRMMEEMLYELRMQYVKEMRGGSPEGGKN